jgi:hypothetical protein
MRLRRLVLCLALIMIIGHSSAQIFIKGGKTIGTISFEETSQRTFSTNSGIQLGIGYQGEIQPSFCYQVEANFIQKGGIEKHEAKGSDAIYITENISTTINYIEIPALLKYEVGNRKIRFYLSSGISFAIAASGTFVFDQEVIDDDGIHQSSHKGDVKFGKPDPVPPGNPDYVHYVYRNTEAAFQFGTGVTFMHLLVADLRYGHGLVEIYENNGRTRTLQFSIGVFLYKARRKS